MSDATTLNVSHETRQRLECYAALLEKWTPRINLVARSTLREIWKRHIVDSAQVFGLIKHPVTHWADLGSGGGFPGLVVAIMAMERGTPAQITLVESDQRKCAFLHTVLRQTGAQAAIVNKRIEDIAPLKADVLSARALSDLSSLLGFAERHLDPGGVAVFHKGVSWRKEVLAAQRAWKFHYRVATSQTGEGSVILTITGVSRV